MGGERSPLFFDNRRRHRHPSHLFHRFSAVALVFGPAGLSLRYPFQLQRRRLIKNKAERRSLFFSPALHLAYRATRDGYSSLTSFHRRKNVRDDDFIERSI